MTSASAVATDTTAVGVRAARKSRCPARLRGMQSASGLALALFMWGHMFFVSSILLGKDAMWSVTRFFEGYFILCRSYPWIVSIVVASVLSLLVVHAMVALRKFPIDYRQYKIARFRLDPRDTRSDEDFYELVGDDKGVFGCMSLLERHDVCPKKLPLATQLVFIRRKMVAIGWT